MSAKATATKAKLVTVKKSGETEEVPLSAIQYEGVRGALPPTTSLSVPEPGSFMEVALRAGVETSSALARQVRSTDRLVVISGKKGTRLRIQLASGADREVSLPPHPLHERATGRMLLWLNAQNARDAKEAQTCMSNEAAWVGGVCPVFRGPIKVDDPLGRGSVTVPGSVVTVSASPEGGFRFTGTSLVATTYVAVPFEGKKGEPEPVKGATHYWRRRFVGQMGEPIVGMNRDICQFGARLALQNMKGDAADIVDEPEPVNPVAPAKKAAKK